MKVLATTTLYDNSPGHNKFYTISVVEDNIGYDVPYTYGPLYSWTKNGSKGRFTTLMAAQSKMNTIVAKKLAKTYEPGPSLHTPTGSGFSIPTGTHAPTGQPAGSKKPTRPARSKPAPAPTVSDIAKSCQLLTEIDQARALELVQDDAYCAQEKHDGKRMKLSHEYTHLTAVNKKGLACSCSPLYCSSLNHLHSLDRAQGTSETLDGESVGEDYYAFDLLGLDGTDLRGKTYRDRLLQLEFTMPSDLKVLHVVETAYTTVAKAALMQALIQGNKEGIVFKRLDAVHTDGRGGDQFKFKFYATASCLVLKKNAKRSVALGIMDGTGAIIGIGNCTIPPNKDVPAADSIIEVRYLYAYKGGSLYQPTYLGLRDDVDSDECLIDQLKYKAVA